MGTLLSGGLDSSAIVTNLHRRRRFPDEGFHSFSAVYREYAYSEQPYVEAVARQADGLQPHFVLVEPDGVAAELARRAARPGRALSQPGRLLPVAALPRRPEVVAARRAAQRPGGRRGLRRLHAATTSGCSPATRSTVGWASSGATASGSTGTATWRVRDLLREHRRRDRARAPHAEPGTRAHDLPSHLLPLASRPRAGLPP